MNIRLTQFGSISEYCDYISKGRHIKRKVKKGGNVGFKPIAIMTLLMGLLALPTHIVAYMPLYIATCLG